MKYQDRKGKWIVNHAGPKNYFFKYLIKLLVDFVTFMTSNFDWLVQAVSKLFLIVVI